MNLYLDTSIVLRVLLGDARSFRQWGKWTTAYASLLVGIESRRAFDRLRLERKIDDENVASLETNLTSFEQEVLTVPLSLAILRRASAPMRTVVKTLDAIHLATAVLIREREQEDLIFATHDGKQAIAAKALGFVVVG